MSAFAYISNAPCVFDAAPGHTVTTYYVMSQREMYARCTCGWRGLATQAKGHVFIAAVDAAEGLPDDPEPKRVTLTLAVETGALQRALMAITELGEALSALQINLED